MTSFIEDSRFNVFPFYIADFCRDAVFSITAEYNDGALPCQCDVVGSLDFECMQFGGQCNCKPDIIGRRCERCRTGYYNFPNCEACNCPSTALCDAETGECDSTNTSLLIRGLSAIEFAYHR